MKKNRILTESEKKQIIKNKEKVIIESFVNTFNKIKRIDEDKMTQRAVIMDYMFVDGDGSFEAEITLLGNYEATISGNLTNLKVKMYPGEKETRWEPATATHADVGYDSIVFNHIEIPTETNTIEGKNHNEVITILTNFGEKIPEMLAIGIEKKVDIMNHEEYFNDERFAPGGFNPQN